MNRLSWIFPAALCVLTLPFSVKSGSSSGKNIVEYRLPLKSCSLEFYSLAGGYTKIGKGDDQGGRYSHHGFFGSPESYFSISFFCIPKPAEEVCPKELSRWHDVPAEGLPGLYLEHFENINPALGGEAYFSHTNSAVPPPGFSALDFCFGDSTRTLSGTSELGKGRDKKGRDAVLKILKTVHFVDDAALKAPPSPR